MKRKIMIIMCAIIAFTFCGCNMDETGDAENSFDESEFEFEQTIEATESTTYLDLIEKNNCVILCYGVGKDYSEYYLVANQTESYDSVQINVGVIKDNKWLVPLSTDSPFLQGNDKNNYLVTGKDLDFEEKDFSRGKYDIYYVSNACFKCKYTSHSDDETYSKTLFYNAENQKTFNIKEADYWDEDFEYLEIPIIEDEYDVSKTNMIVFSETTDGRGYHKKISVLNTDTMEKKVAIPDTENDLMGPFSDGMFAVGYSYGNDIYYFYDVNGKKLLDVTKYKEYDYESNYFVDGEFSYTLKNSAGTPYRITIDKQGKVINEETISDDE